MYFQNDDILSNLFSFGDLKIFLNRKMYTSHVEFIQKIDSTYVPRTKFPLNRTILDSKSNMYVQLDININICEIIIPSNHIEFKKNMFNHVINFMIESIKSFCDFRLANEVGYKILLYIPTKSPASQINWWLDTVSNKISFKQENGVVGKTVLGTNLSEQYVRYTLHIFFNEQYVLVKNSQSYFPQENTTLAEILKKHEYQTAAFVGNFILRKEKGLNKGFQVYDDTYPQEEKVRHLPERIASSLSDAAINWISQHYKKKFFLWLHYQDPHGPYTPPYPYNKKFSINLYTGNTKIKLLNKDDDSGWGGIPWYQQIEGKQDARFYISQYDGEILYLDHHIGRLINVIKKLKLDKKTLIIITADHGEALDNAHGYYFSHENGLTDDQIKVPLIIKFPGCEKIQKIIKDPVSTINIMPTILDIIGVSTPSNLQGKNLFKSRRNYVFGENHLGTQNFSIRMDHFKLIYRDKKKNFYDLLKDPIESKNIYNPQNKNCEKMENILIEYIEKTKQIKTKAKTLTPTQEDIRRLKSLGYL